MGTGWRRAFCTKIHRDRDSSIGDKQQHEEETCKGQSSSLSPRGCAKLGFLSNPSTPSLRCQTNHVAQMSSATDSLVSPKLQCKTTTPKSATKTPRKLRGSNPSSPRSPFSILKNSLRLSRNGCGVCLQSVKTGQGTAIYTAECSHAFHFPCIAAHVSKNGALVCPVCNTTWRDVPLLAIHKIQTNTANKQDQLKALINEKQHQTKQEPPFPNTPASLKSLKIKQQNKEVDGRAYDDDEPLLSPTAGSGFVPIPEEEDVDDEVEEFQGFFVNPISSSSDESAINGGDLRNVEVSLIPEAAVVSVGRTHEAYAVALRVKAPPPPPLPPVHNSNSVHFLDPGRRAPIDLVTVLDVSGSMSGAKLQMLKRAMRLVISSLGSADRLSIVAFSASPKRLLPLRRMSGQGQRSARRIIDRLVCRQGTSVAEALKKATRVLEYRRERNPVASIMLLSDGQDESVQSNESNRRPGSTHVSSTRFAHVEIPVRSSSFGYNNEPAEDAFTKCVSGLLSVVVQDFRIELGFASGSDPGEISAVYSCNGRPTVLNPKSIRLGDLYAEEEREFLVELRIPAPVVGSHHVLSVRCSYKDPATQETINGREQSLLVPRAQTVRSPNLKIERLRNFFVTTRAIAESRRLIEHNNDLASAYNLLASARALLLQLRSPSAEEGVRGLEAEMAEVRWRRQCQVQLDQHSQVVQRRKEVVLTDENGEPLTPTSAWRAAEQLAKVAMMKNSVNRVSDLHGFENARF
ncbi:Von Willebrand factor, type A protein [Actinidia chinensis var. chinensis]|uniref:von Willebrand factor, type A protein n=1 Tax=Actinidia chinensis var. chinensis TaxID=1590841 RepID=A0A2R6Q0N4_ACTCC|nr:Von Willebrand factor, type A protein [Actinidia chinensis var. chinensis]